MTFPCLVCGDLPVVDQPLPQPSFGGTTASSSSSSAAAGSRVAGNSSNHATFSVPPPTTGGNKKAGGATIRTLSKDVSDKIFQNLCRHLYVKSEPYWFIQNPGEQMPLCAFCSGVVLEIYTLQTKVDQFQAMIKKMVWKLERIVADTEIAGNWMATREEQESEEEMWNGIPCPPMAIRIARERHHKFRQQILQNFKSKVKLRQKMRAAGQQGDEMFEVEPTFTVSLSESVFDSCSNGGEKSGSENPVVAKKPRLEETTITAHHQTMPSLIRAQLSQSPLPSSRSSPSQGANRFNPSSTSQLQQQQQSVKIPSTISVSAVGGSGERRQNDYRASGDDSEMDDEQESHQLYPDVQIVCSDGPADYFKEEQEYSNSGDGEDSTLEQDSYNWGSVEGDDDQMEAMAIGEGDDVVWLAPGLAIRKSFVNQLLAENLKPSVFLRKLVFAVFGMKQVANSSGISGSNKPGAKPSLDRYKFEALREYTIETYGIRDNIAELEDLNRKIRTICCDARKALKRKILKTTLSNQSSSSNILVDSFPAVTSISAGSSTQLHSHTNLAPANIPDLYHLSSNGGAFSSDGNAGTTISHDEDDAGNEPGSQLPASLSMEEQEEEDV